MTVKLARPVPWWRRMPWNWRPAGEGKVWVRQKDLIQLLRDALDATERAAELETEAAAQRRETELLEAEVGARRLLLQLDPRGELDRDSLLAELPLTLDGRLHEDAFRARLWVEQGLNALLANDN